MTFDHLLSDEECDGIVEAVGGRDGEYLVPSLTAKPVKQSDGRVLLTDVPDEIRTSHQAWCQHEWCSKHSVHAKVIERIMRIVDLPPSYAEHMQLLKYGPGQFYLKHHDWIDQQLHAKCGPRVYTFFLYLSGTLTFLNLNLC